MASSDIKYKAGLYDEVWTKAKELGLMNVTDALEELKLLREYRASGMAFNDSQGEGYTVEASIKAEARMEAAEKACHDFYGKRPIARGKSNA